MSELSHVDEAGGIRMVDVGAKPLTRRRAVARATVRMAAETAARLRELPKGDALVTAQLAGIMAAKRTHELIPLCHPAAALGRRRPARRSARRRSRSRRRPRPTAQTGVEMEALVAASVAALTVYDMAKAIDKGMVVTGRHARLEDEGAGVVRAAVLTVSDGVHEGTREDRSGDLLAELLAAEGFDGRAPGRARRRRSTIAAAISELAETAAVVLTTGGTGFAPRDVTPEATARVLDREAPGLAEAIRADARERTPHALLSRGRRRAARRDGRRQPARARRAAAGTASRCCCPRSGTGSSWPPATGDGAPPDMTTAVVRLPRLFARLVKLEHTVFALPFAYTGAFLARGGRAVGPRPRLDHGGDGRCADDGHGPEPADRRRDRRSQPAHRLARASVRAR